MMERNELVVVTQLKRQHAPSWLLLVLIACFSADCVGETPNMCCVTPAAWKVLYSDDVLQHLLTDTTLQTNAHQGD